LLEDAMTVLETCYDYCRRVNRRAGSSFHRGFLLLPPEKRRAMEALYAFMRRTDDLADDAAIGSPEPRRAALAAWRTALEAALAEKTEGRKAEISVPPSPFRLPPSLILPALADAVRRFHIPHEHLYAAIDGVEMDLEPRRYETFDDLQQYCERVASAVGLACIYIWGFRGSEAFEPARKAGIALQLTNILRDLKADAAAGRVYLPQADLRAHDYSEAALRAGVADQRFHDLVAEEIARAEQFYAEGAELMDWLDTSGQRIFGLMMTTYRALLQQIAARPADVFCRHIRPSRLKKLRLAARWTLLPPTKEALR
jgi:15-cis-phytoene synthase